MILEFETEKVTSICKVASINGFGEIVEDYISKELNRYVEIRADKLFINIQGGADELDIITEILQSIFTFQDFKCIFLNRIFNLNEVTHGLARMHQGHNDELASVCATRVASQYKDVYEIVCENKYEFGLKVCEAYKELVELDNEEIKRISAYLKVMTDGFSRVQPAMEGYTS